MAKVGRGRSRGGRILDVPPITLPTRGMGMGRSMLGRGTSLLTPGQFADDHPEMHKVNNGDEMDSEVEARNKLMEDLSMLLHSRKGSVLHMTLKYFDSCADVEFFIDKAVEAMLESSYLVEKFTMSYKLITMMKLYGETIKTKMFKKLQCFFKDMEVLMKEGDRLTSAEKEKVRNFCDLLGQIYFRFRVSEVSMERYNVLTLPVLECFRYLAKVRGRHELKLLAKLISFNMSAIIQLQEERVSELWVDILQAFLDGIEDTKETVWLLYALQLLSKDRSSFPSKVEEFFSRTLEQDWSALPKSRTQMLADIPPDIVNSQINKFNIDVEEYTRNRYITL